MSASKARGTRAESAIVEALRHEYGEQVERLVLAGANDCGDAYVKDDDLYIVIEAKDRKRMDLAGAVDEALKERDNFARARKVDPAKCMPIAIIKRRGKNIRDAYVVTTLDEYFRKS